MGDELIFKPEVDEDEKKFFDSMGCLVERYADEEVMNRGVFAEVCADVLDHFMDKPRQSSRVLTTSMIFGLGITSRHLKDPLPAKNVTVVMPDPDMALFASALNRGNPVVSATIAEASEDAGFRKLDAAVLHSHDVDDDFLTGVQRVFTHGLKPKGLFILVCSRPRGELLKRIEARVEAARPLLDFTKSPFKNMEAARREATWLFMSQLTVDPSLFPWMTFEAMPDRCVSQVMPIIHEELDEAFIQKAAARLEVERAIVAPLLNLRSAPTFHDISVTTIANGDLVSQVYKLTGTVFRTNSRSYGDAYMMERRSGEGKASEIFKFLG